MQLWRNHDLKKLTYSHLFIDVIYIKVRANHKVISKACHIGFGISEEGKRDIVGLEISKGETEDTWSDFIEKLKKRGLCGLKMVISDAHKGLVKAIKETLVGVKLA